MKNLVKIAIAATLMIGVSSAALAVQRGGILKYGRYPIASSSTRC